MSTKPRSHVDDLRGAGRLAVEATRGVTSLVEAMHATIAGGPAILGQPFAGPARAATGLIYGAVRGVTALVGAGVDRALAQLAPLLGSSVAGNEREAVLAALNGVLGDYLLETSNPLAIEMTLRCEGKPGSKLLVLVHGSSMSDRQWLQAGHDHGAALARELGFTPIYLRYNSGLHISTNGRALADQLEHLVSTWPTAIDEITLLGHSMGGLVARSACHAGADHAWRSHLRALITLGAPHHGAPLERGGNWIDLLLGISRYSAPLVRLGMIRSAGVTDLRYGNVLDEHWQGRDRFEYRADDRTPLPLPAGVRCYAIAGSLSPAAGARERGDGLVSVASALGLHARPELTLAFPDAHRWVAYGTGHVQLLGSATVYDALRTWLTSRAT
ncbi:MAG: alpha/beta hydrolase [Deltaproteobacteria bacterium]